MVGGIVFDHGLTVERGVGDCAAGRDLPNLILLDMHLPGASGYDVVKRLKADERTVHIPVIAVTSDAMTADETRARAAGCDDYVAKPYRPHQLMDAIRRHLSC